ncbi:MAG TPA: SPFH domain-containing protein [Candidatus Thermoplasmatota archaeon]|nr:SPFH domain-containing protein [Candidatus Thermoplasmatota archaeon]
MVEVLTIVSVLILIAILVIALTGVRIIQPYEQGLWIVLGKYKGKLNPGFNWVYPLISQVVKLDLRTQVIDVPRQEVITKDNSPTNVDAVVYIRVLAPDKAFFEVTNYKLATINLAQTNLRSVIGDMELDEILYNRAAINARLRDILDESTDQWGVKVEAVEIREVDPVGPVKAAMEEQTSAERNRRAAILRADGEKRAKILEAEGSKRARILEAEGFRQARILEAEGERTAQILKSQGEAQGLRILALGSATLDQKSLAVLSLEAVKKLGDGQATKIVLPFEITHLMSSIATNLGGAAAAPPYQPNDLSKLETQIGSAEVILGKVPTPESVEAEVRHIEHDAQADIEAAEAIAHKAERPGVPPGLDLGVGSAAGKGPSVKPDRNP